MGKVIKTARFLEPIKKLAKSILSPEFRKQQQREREAFNTFRIRSEALWKDRPVVPPAERTVLVMSSGLTHTIGIELALLESMRMAGFRIVILMQSVDDWLMKYYYQWDCKNIIFWDDFADSSDVGSLPRLDTFEDVLDFEVLGAKVGKYAASQLMREKRIGHFDPTDEETWQLLVKRLHVSVQYSAAADRILKHVDPHTALFIDRGYSPWGQMFDLCIKQGVDTLQWCNGHKDNALVLKRFNSINSAMHHTALSNQTWADIKDEPWDESIGEQVRKELYENYASGKWFSEVGTQFNKVIHCPEELKSQMELDQEKKTAVIFAHMFWDASFFYGEDLFEDYEDWFVQTIRAAIENTELNWIVKVHPANTTKDRRDGFIGESSEIGAIRRYFGSLPKHIKILESDNAINTYSLFSLMDYCVTVRGTIGLESSSFGIPVLTAGTGRYDQLGFTIDSVSTDEYLQRLRYLHEVERLSPEELALSQRYAHAVLLRRPFLLESVTLVYEQDEKATPKVTFPVSSIRELVEADDMRSFVAWSCESDAEDYLV